MILLRGIAHISTAVKHTIDLAVLRLLGNGQLPTQIVLFMSTRSERGISIIGRLIMVNRNRWEGTYDGTVGTAVVGTPGCPGNVGCSCTPANANASDYSDEYKKFLSDFYIAQVKHTCHRFFSHFLDD